jgi:hypothetical protein
MCIDLFGIHNSTSREENTGSCKFRNCRVAAHPLNPAGRSTSAFSLKDLDASEELTENFSRTKNREKRPPPPA